MFAGLGLIALMLGSTFTLVDSLVVMFAFVASWFAEPPAIDSPGYSRFWNTTAVVLLLVQVARAIGGEAVLTVGVQYAAFLQISRLAHRKTAADYQQIAILAFLHLIAGTVLSSGLDFGVVFFGFVIVMPWMLTLTHLRKELENQHGVGSPVLRAELDSSKLTSGAFFAGTTLLAVPLFLLTAAMFFAFPRVGFGFLSSLGTKQMAVAGFGDDVELGGFGTIRDDPTVVMRVKTSELPSPPPRSIPIRLRGTSFDSYHEGRWSRTHAAGDEVRRAGEDYLLARRPSSDDASYEIILDPMEEAVLFLPPGTVSVRIAPTIRAGRRVHRKVMYSPGFDFRYRGAVDGPLTYTAYVGDELVGISERISDKHFKRYVEVPPDYERISQLAQSIAGDITDTKAQARRIESYLRTTLQYTLDQPDTRGKDPLHVFLFDAKAGHCEYFSTAMAIMMRSLGVPARNVTGFVGADFNPYGNYYAVRNGNAHSWVEIYDGKRWLTYDPTPVSAQALSVPSGLAVKFRQIVDALRVRWAEYVVEFNIRDQTRALQGVAGWFRSLRDKSDGFGSRRGKKNGDDDTIGSLSFRPDWRWFIAVMTIFGVAVAITRWRRRLRRQNRAGRRLDPDRDRAVRLYLSLEGNLRKAGQPRPDDVTPREHAATLRAQGFVAAKEVDEVTGAYLATRFGGSPLPLAEYHRLRQLSRSVKQRPKTPPTV
jgi:transglutaminase-like putative cysteine protease